MTKRQARGLGMILLVALCLGLVTHALHAEALHAEKPLACGDAMIRKTMRSSHVPANISNGSPEIVIKWPCKEPIVRDINGTCIPGANASQGGRIP